MKRPKIAIENRQAVYEWHRNYTPNQRLSKVGYWAMAQAYRPVVSYDESIDKIKDKLDNGTQLVLAVNHVNFFDQFPLAALAHHIKPLRTLRGTTDIPVKPDLSRPPLLGRAIDLMGGITAFRARDVRRNYKEVPFTVEEDAVRLDAAERLIQTHVQKLNTGRNLGIFPEGTRGSGGNDRTLGRVRDGIGRIVCGVDESVTLGILPIGLYFGDSSVKRFGKFPGAHHFTPNMHIGRMIEGPFTNPEHVTTTVQDAIQDALSQAVAENKRQ